MRAPLLLVFALLAACATPQPTVGTMIPGRITSLSTGDVLPMQIELSYGSGKMTAADPKTGEQFAGTYTAILKQSVVQQTQSNFWGPQGTTQAIQTSNVAGSSAVLVGDKGTVINITMQIKPGNPPIGFGEGVDNKGRKYNVQF